MSTVVNSTTPARKFNGWGLLALVTLIVTAGLIGVRVKAKVAQNKELDASRQTSAATTPEAAKNAASSAPLVSEIISPKPTKWQPRVDITGTLEPIQQADVGFKMGGRLLTIKVKAGDVVKNGQVLGIVDAAEASAQARVAKTGVDVAQVSFEMAKDAQKRTDSLFDQKAIAEAEKTTATQRAMLAAAQLEQARAQLRVASVAISNATLQAPFSGLVTRVPAGIGKIVGPGEPLFHLEDTSVLKLSASLSESDARIVSVGANVSIEGAPNAQGKVTAVLGSLDPQTRRVPMIAEIPNGADSGLLAGSFVRAQVVAADPIDAMELPSSAIRPGSQDEVVVVKDGKAHLVRVSYSSGQNGLIYVRKGLEASDRVQARPRSEVKEGDVVEEAPAAK